MTVYASFHGRKCRYAVGNRFLGALYTLLHDGNMLSLLNKSTGMQEFCIEAAIIITGHPPEHALEAFVDRQECKKKMVMHSLDRLAECWTLVHGNESRVAWWESLLCQQGLLALVLIVTILMISCKRRLVILGQEISSTLKSHSRRVWACTPSGLSTTLDRRITTIIFCTTSCILPTSCAFGAAKRR